MTVLKYIVTCSSQYTRKNIDGKMVPTGRIEQIPIYAHDRNEASRLAQQSETAKSLGLPYAVWVENV